MEGYQPEGTSMHPLPNTSLKEDPMKPIQTLLLCALSLFLAMAAPAQDTATPKENSGTHQTSAGSGPLVVKWSMKKIKGSANLMVNPDGTYLFSGDVKDKRPDHDFNIAVALKSSQGGVIVFQYSGNVSDGVQWSKQGQSDILKDDYQSFAGKVNWAGEWRISLSAAGEAKRYAEREKKREKLRKEEAEAKKRHEEKVAEEKKKEEEKIEQEQIAAAQAAAQRQQSGGGSSIGSDISGIASTVGSVVSTISSVGQAIASLF